MKRKFLLLVLCCWCPTLLAETFFLSWGQVRNQGFVFYGKKEVIQAQCLLWMNQQGIRRIRRIRIRHKNVAVGGNGDFPFACREIINKSLSLGDTERQVDISIAMNNRHYVYAGGHRKIIFDCLEDLRQQSITALNHFKVVEVTNLSPLRIEKKDFKPAFLMQGPEICGDIAALAHVTKGPFIDRYISGSIYNIDFSFYGYKEQFIDSCTQYIRNNQIARTNTISVGKERKVFSDFLREELACEVLFKLALVETDPVKRYEIDGKVRAFGFYFVGTRGAILANCGQWLRQNGVRSIPNVLIDTETLQASPPMIGRAVCYEIAKRAIPIPGVASLKYGAGVVQNRGFALVATLEEANSRCLAFLQQNGIGFTNRFRMLGKEIVLKKPLRLSELCAQIIKKASTISDDAIGWTWSASGEVLGQGFAFRGTILEFIQQCSLFFQSRPSLQRIGSFSISDENGTKKDFPLSPNTVGAETCYKIAEVAEVEEVSKKVFYSGQVGGLGLSLTTNQGISQLYCKINLERNGIRSARSIRVFDRIISFQGAPLGSPDAICAAFEARGVELEKFPLFKAVSGEVAGHSFTFEGHMDEMNNKCLRWVLDKGITQVEKIRIEGRSFSAPLGDWEGFEICGVVVRYMARNLMSQ